MSNIGIHGMQTTQSACSASSASGNINLTHPPHKKKGIIPMPLSLN
ncbi:hypothetical protein PRABACTJOHN_00204 [Parabacteroides johnsonii DSM 18315]|uniref:Uncharacterized protein n=1 Tax=Parabacteroides johnsonii DSM 18315 TaxID=537006 RepID=B7B596_9BACT|nr:hypothetical protein PRABACTJOHN_00204 [Parabacteroides johnsonii DSM 18315]